MVFRQRLLLATICWLFITVIPGLAQDWFSNHDTIPELARMAPQDSDLFIALNLGELLAPERVKKMKEGLATNDFSKGQLRGLESGIGYPLEDLGQVMGPRAFVSVNKEKKAILIGVEAQDPQRVKEFFAMLGLLSNHSPGEKKSIGDQSFRRSGRSTYGLYQDYFLITNKEQTLQSVFAERQTLDKAPAFQAHQSRVMVEQGAFVYGHPPAGMGTPFSGFEYLLASLGMSHSEFLSQAFVVVRQESGMGSALLSHASTLTGEAARFVPNEWGFLATLDLGYLQRVREKAVRAESPSGKELNENLEEAEQMFGVTLPEILKVSTGEVSISSNGAALAPKHFLGIQQDDSSATPYALTVTLSLTDSRAADLLLKRAWQRHSLRLSKRYDGIAVVSGTELAYKVMHDSDLLILSYGTEAEDTLRSCLALRNDQSLLSRDKLRRQFPQPHCISSVYFDMEPVVRETRSLLGGNPALAMLAGADLENVARLEATKEGLYMRSSGGTPLLLTAAGAAFFWLKTGNPNSAAPETVEQDY